MDFREMDEIETTMDEALLNNILGALENKLKELMTPDEFEAFVVEVERDSLKKAIDSLPDSEFKKFALEDFEKNFGGMKGVEQ